VADLPPSTASLASWTKLDRSAARKTIASAISSGVAGCPGWCLSVGRVAAKAHVAGLLQASPGRSLCGVEGMLCSIAGFRRELVTTRGGKPKATQDPASQHVRADCVKECCLCRPMGRSHDAGHAGVCALQRCSLACRFPPLPLTPRRRPGISTEQVISIAPATGTQTRSRPGQHSLRSVQPNQCLVRGLRHRNRRLDI
jgi:hypothetical protein